MGCVLHMPRRRRVEGAWRMHGLRRGEGAFRGAILRGAVLRGGALRGLGLKGASLRHSSGSDAVIIVTLAARPCSPAIGDGDLTQTSRQHIDGRRRRGWLRQGWRRRRSGRLRGHQRGRGGGNDRHRFDNHVRALHEYPHASLQLLLGKGRQLLGFVSGDACCVGDSGLNPDAGTLGRIVTTALKATWLGFGLGLGSGSGSGLRLGLGFGFGLGLGLGSGLGLGLRLGLGLGRVREG